MERKPDFSAFKALSANFSSFSACQLLDALFGSLLLAPECGVGPDSLTNHAERRRGDSRAFAGCAGGPGARNAGCPPKAELARPQVTMI